MSRARESGQALIYGLFVLVGGLAALFFLFNSGQLSREKTKLVNATDAVAYSGGVMNARALNFHAYTNRAMVANTVAIAQLVSLSSWVEYANNLGRYGEISALQPKFLPFYPSYYMAATAGQTLHAQLNQSAALQELAEGSDRIIRNVLMNSQQVAHVGLLLARKQVMDEVASANYRGDGTVSVDPLSLIPEDYLSKVSRYDGDERTRFAEVAKVAADKDPFVPRRSWSLPAIPFAPTQCASANAMGRFDWFDRRGGTELLGFDEWRAVDTLSEKRWVPKSKTDVFCQGLAETPAGWGGRSASDTPSGGWSAMELTHHDSAMAVNPGSFALAALSSNAWNYSGLPSFFDLSEDTLKQASPTLQLAVRVRRHRSQTRTSEGRSAILGSEHLNAYKAEMAGGDEMAAVSTSEVFFQRDGDNRDNVYGSTFGRPVEVGGLFNPFWQVRLIHSNAATKAAQALQGVVLP